MSKMKFVRRVEENLLMKFDEKQIEMIIAEITKALADFDVAESKRELMEYTGINETIVKRFCACMVIEGKSKKTIAQYKRTAELLIEDVQKNYTEIGVFDIRLFLAHKKQDNASNRTLENYRAYLSAFFQWMLREELIRKNPCDKVSSIKYTDKVKYPFSTVEIDSLRMSCENDKERAIVELLLSSGVRVSELVNIKLMDVNFENLSIHITTGKGDKERTVFMSELAKNHLCKYITNRKVNGEYLFYNFHGKRLNDGGVRYILRELGKRAKVDNVHPHRFRRTFATSLAGRGMDIQEIRKLMGHSDINTTLCYVYTSDDKIKNSYMRYSA